MRGVITKAADDRGARWPKPVADDVEPRSDAEGPVFETVSPERLETAKRSYATRRIDIFRARHLISSGLRPRSGDFMLARVGELGHHRRLESPDGRRRQLYVGDEVLLCLADRYASDQFEARVPESLEPCHMVAAGGIAARCISRHDNTRPATKIEPIGIVADGDKQPLNLIDFAMPACEAPALLPYTIAVVGTSMNAGKTTTASALVHGLSANGFRVAAGKVTGTGAGGDRWSLIDAGAREVLDFTDFGYASTYTLPLEETEAILRQTSHALARARCDVIVLEVADGLFFSETADLVVSKTFRTLVDDILLAAGDAIGADAGTRWLREHAFPPLAVAGRLTSSPLAVREAEAAVTGPVVGLRALTEGSWVPPGLKRPVEIPA